MERTTILRAWECAGFRDLFRTGVSLHSHTSASREQLSFLSGFKGQFPIIPTILRLAARQHQRATGEQLDIRRAGWRPPLDTQAAFEIEARQIRSLGLVPLVSLTDHDHIGFYREMPVSVEWTVPFGATFFHIGVHNLPPRAAAELWSEMRAYTMHPGERRLAETLDLLDAYRGVMTVLNHPLWDEAGIGGEAHAAEAASFLQLCSHWIHAIELNGLRSPAENASAIQLAESWRKPLVSGGDRHGAEPNACINLTNARTFSEFVEEVRGDGESTVVFLPQYREPLRLRWLQTVWDIVRTYPEVEAGRRHWSDRFFYRCEDGVERSVAQVWKTPGPPVLNQALSMLRLASIPTFRPALRLILADE